MALRLIESYFLSLQYWLFCSVLFCSDCYRCWDYNLKLTWIDENPSLQGPEKKKKIIYQTATLLLRAVFVQWIVLFKCVKQMFYHACTPTTPKQLVSIFSTSNNLISRHSFNKSERMHFFEHSTSFQRPTYSSPPYLFSLLLYFIFAVPH